jgi:hypothetical protein
MISRLLCALFLFGALVGCSSNRVDVTHTNLPAPVQATLEHEAAGGTVNKVVKETTTTSVTYKADVSATDGQKWDVVIDGSGKLVYKHLK